MILGGWIVVPSDNHFPQLVGDTFNDVLVAPPFRWTARAVKSLTERAAGVRPGSPAAGAT